MSTDVIKCLPEDVERCQSEMSKCTCNIMSKKLKNVNGKISIDIKKNVYYLIPVLMVLIELAHSIYQGIYAS